jgi:hypothetical protein
MHARTLCLYEHLRRTKPIDLKVVEITTGLSLLTGTLPTTKKITLNNSKINSNKYKHQYQSKT